MRQRHNVSKNRGTGRDRLPARSVHALRLASADDQSEDAYGDANPGEPGAEFIFFATGAPFTDETLIDAIAINRITDPTLAAFVERSRR